MKNQVVCGIKLEVKLTEKSSEGTPTAQIIIPATNLKIA